MPPRARDAAGIAPRPGALFSRRAARDEAPDGARPCSPSAPGGAPPRSPSTHGGARPRPPGAHVGPHPCPPNAPGSPPLGPRPAAAAPPRRPHPGREREARFRLLFDDSYEFVGRLLRRLGVPRDVVDDAAQEVFLVTSRRLDDIARGRERAFVFGVAMRVASGHRRAAARDRQAAPSGALDAFATPDPGPDALADERRARETLDRILGGMTFDLRNVIELFEFEELTAIEIARRLAIPQGTVMSRLRRARQQLQALADAAAPGRASA